MSSGKSGKLQQRLSISGRKVFRTGRAEPLCLPRLDPRPADPSWKLKSQHLQASPHPQVPSQLLAELPLHVAAHWDQGQAGTKAAGRGWWVVITWATG